MNDTTQPAFWALTRASTLKQAESPATQHEIMEAARKTLGLPEPQFLDEPLGTSARSKKFAERPMGCFLMQVLRKGDTLMVTKLDRLGRNLRDIYDTVDALFNRGVNVIILHGWGGAMVDMSNATHRIMLLLLAWFAEYEGEQIAERTRAGLQHRRDNGLCAGHRLFTYSQAYDASGQEISKAEFDKLKGHYKLNLPDKQWLDQICELLALQRYSKLRGNALYDYCEERKFVDRRGRQWWKGGLHINAHGTPYRNAIQTLLKKVRRMAVLGQLPEEYNERVLAITGDTPAVLEKKFKRKPRVNGLNGTAVNRAHWTLEDWQRDYATGYQPPP